MSRPALEVAEIFREHKDAFLNAHDATLLPDQRRVLTAIMRCRTAALGGHKLACTDCDHEEISYNSCRNRHCPKCQATAQAQWLADRAADLLPVRYFHVVFTLPDDLRPLALRNQKALYGLLFQVAADTLRTIARDPKHLGAEIGSMAILHTWGQNLLSHPHLHFVVPGGGLSFEGDRWMPSRQNFFLSVRVLSRLFRRKFIEALQALFRQGTLSIHGALESRAKPEAWAQFLKRLKKHRWVVYAKPPFGGPVQVLKYLARYTHRVAFSNRRLVAASDGAVTFRWKDYRSANMIKLMTLDAVEFMRRFLLHVLPWGFVRIRHFGFLSNGVREKKLERIRSLLPDEADPRVAENPSPIVSGPEEPTDHCPKCKCGRLVVTEILRPKPGPEQERSVVAVDTS